MRLTLKLVLLLTPLFYILPSCAMAETQVLTQRDWVISLVDTLGYNFGLSDTPQDNDYIKLLEGSRTFRFEAEETKNPEDLVAINDYSSYGDFSGSGWVSSLSTPTMVRLNFLLPHSGHYRLFAGVRLAGHTLMLEGQTWQVTENNQKFQRVEFGEIALDAGMKELAISMPVNGSLDYIEFVASPLPLIVPLTGWKLSAPLSNADLTVTTIRALELQSFLPLQNEQILIEAEINAPQLSFVTDQRHLGEPHGGAWLRIGANPEDLSIPFSVGQDAVYTVDLIAEGSSILSGEIDGRDPWETTFPPYLKEESIGTWFLTAGQHELKIKLPSRGGVDLLTLSKRRSSAEDYLVLAGLPAHGDVETSTANRLLTLLSRMQNRD